MVVEIGQKAPDVRLVDTEKKPVKISDFRGKATVLLFFPGAFTSTCTKEMCTFRDNLQQYNTLDANVVGISVDPPFSAKAFKSANNLNFALLSDYTRAAVNAYDVVHNDFSGLPGYAAAKRSVFVLDKNQNIRFKWVADNPNMEPDYSVVAKETEKAKAA
jgi:glutaredoxin-dependent peroxiredoxin